MSKDKSRENDERWLPVLGYEGLYEVSDLGRVRSVDRMEHGANWQCPHGFMRTRRGKLIKPLLKRNGYLQVNLYKDRKMRSRAVHRLVIEAFRGPSDLTVNHINEVKTDNRLCNLEYMTAGENIRYSKAIPIESYDLATGQTVKKYGAGKDVCVDGFDVSAVNHCVRKAPRYLSHHGLGWRLSIG